MLRHEQRLKLRQLPQESEKLNTCAVTRRAIDPRSPELVSRLSADDGIHNLCELAAGVGERVEIVLARTARLDQAAVTQQRKMMAHGRLALRAEIAAKLGDVAFFFAQEHKHLKASRIRNLLQ